MTTTAQAIPALEVSAPDDNMDVLSDTGFDFGDGDIDLDLDTAPSVHDDDMSLNDAATDGGVDMEEPSADQDDFMADHGDLIDDDDVYNDNIASSAVPQIVDEDSNTIEADMLAPPDEDLIDYSDDEAQPHVKMHSPTVHDGAETRVSPNDETPVPVDDSRRDEQTYEEEQSFEAEVESPPEAQQVKDGIAETRERTETSSEHQPLDPQSQREDKDDDHVHVEDGGVPLPANEHSYSHSRSDDENIIPEQQEELQEVTGDDTKSNDNKESIELRPVTVNYAGNELWLFKQHDLDESGDFLLEDLSVAKSSMSNLFQACRASLGDDVSGEHEIGFQFDHLHNLELYEDNTACVAVSLERLVDLYHTLQAQDGNMDPECFYMTLQFRPRFATLLADVAQYAEQGSGYSALDAAVAAGETHFSNVFSSASTEHDNVEWDEEENEIEDASSPKSIHSIAPDEVEAAEYDHHSHASEGEEHEQDDSDQERQQGVDLKDEWNEETHIAEEIVDSGSRESSANEGISEHVEATRNPESAAGERHASQPLDERTPDQIAHEKQEAEDFVDYSDDEDEQEKRSEPAREPSPSSSTVQGDEPSPVQGPGSVLEHEEHDDDGAATGVDFVENDDDTTLLAQTHYGDGANHYAFQDYAETCEQGDAFQDYQANDATEGEIESADAYNGDTNQGFAEYEFQDLAGEVNLSFDEQPSGEAHHGDQGNETFEAIDDVTHADAFFDLDNAPEWAIDADPAPNLPGEDAVLLHDDETLHEDEEGGVVEQHVATMPSAAESILSSSHDDGPLSPQGKKRSIDEVGEGIDNAPNSTDAKRPRV